MTYWEKLTPAQRSQVMKQRRAKGIAAGKIAGGMHFIDLERRKIMLEKARKAKKNAKNSTQGQDQSESQDQPKVQSQAQETA